MKENERKIKHLGDKLKVLITANFSFKIVKI